MSATIVVDLGFGDAGKGSIVDYLARVSGKVSAVVRFNGGGQAAHNVVTPDGIHHTFAQFGSASFVPGVRTHLSRFMLVDPLSLSNEADHLIACGLDPYAGLTVDENAMVVTIFHKIANRARETARGVDRHGTCGMGIGETMALDMTHPDLTIRVRDLRDQKVLHAKLARLLDWVVTDFQYPELARVGTLGVNSNRDTLLLDNMACLMHEIAKRFTIVDDSCLADLARSGELIFEGAQGVLIDETYGFHPYTTWSTCTFKNALTLLSEIGYAEPVTRLGLLRAYMVRHGPGPFPTEDNRLLVNPDEHNEDEGWQGKFRVGHFDAVLARYAIEVCGGIDRLAITNIDKLLPPSRSGPNDWALCHAYDGLSRLRPATGEPTLRAQEGLGRFLTLCEPEYSTAPFDKFLPLIEAELAMAIAIKSYGPKATDKVAVL